jgi:hypothetical protein
MKATSCILALLAIQLVLSDATTGVAFDFGNEYLKVAAMDSKAYQLIDIVVNEVANRYLVCFITLIIAEKVLLFSVFNEMNFYTAMKPFHFGLNPLPNHSYISKNY